MSLEPSFIVSATPAATPRLPFSEVIGGQKVEIENMSTVGTYSSHQQTTLRDELLQQSNLHQRVDQKSW